MKNNMPNPIPATDKMLNYIEWQMKSHRALLGNFYEMEKVKSRQGYEVSVDRTYQNFHKWMEENLDNDKAYEIVGLFKDNNAKEAITKLQDYGM